MAVPLTGRRQHGGAGDLGAVRAAVYHRVSTVDQDPAAARAELAAYARRIGALVVLDVEEIGSGARNDRPGWRRVLEAAARGRVDVVIVWALDRCGRSALDVLASIDRLTAAGVRFVAASQSIDVRPGGDAMSQLTITILAAVAQFERAMIRERTRVGMARARERGSRIGRPRVERPSRERVEQLLAAGRTTAEVAAELGVTPWAVRSARGDLPSRARARAAAIATGRRAGPIEIRAVARPGRSQGAESQARETPGH